MDIRPQSPHWFTHSLGGTPAGALAHVTLVDSLASLPPPKRPAIATMQYQSSYTPGTYSSNHILRDAISSWEKVLSHLNTLQ
jgi:beta-lactamase regulating signal transducer with metallopeptidase domain